MTVLYIDVSHYDWSRYKGNLDWATIKSTGVDVVFIRATYGDPEIYNPETRYFVDMALAAKQAGLLVGGYHNLIHGDFASIQRQVTYFRDVIDSVGADFAMLDVEPYDALKENDLWPRLSDAELFAQEFSNQDKTRTLGIYLARWVWAGWLDSADLRPLMEKAKGPLINANYPLGKTSKDYRLLYTAVGQAGWTCYGNVCPAIWQYSSSALVPGASSLTDVNAFEGSLTELTGQFTKEANLSGIEDIFWPEFKKIEPTVQLGGIYANKRGYHNKRQNLPMPGDSTDYSVNQFAVDREGPADEASAIDLTFPDAHSGDYKTISKYSKRLYAARNEGDERTKYIREFFGNIDDDRQVEGWDFSKNRASTSDTSHLWHIHLSFHRKYINSTTAMRAVLSILRGESLEVWRAGGRRTVTYEYFASKLPVLKKNDSDPVIENGAYFVNRAQRALQVAADGDYGPITANAVKALGISGHDGNTIDLPVWTRLHGLWGSVLNGTSTEDGAERSITHQHFNGHLPVLKFGDSDEDGLYEGGTYYVTRAQRQLRVTVDGDYGPETQAAVKTLMGAGDGKTIDLDVWIMLLGLWGAQTVRTEQVKRK